MTLEVTFRERATSQAAGFLPDDPEGLKQVFAAVDALVLDPCPADSFALGTSGMRRLRVRRYRVIYRTREIIWITHIGRVPASS